jgi:hypothetical protein
MRVSSCVWFRVVSVSIGACRAGCLHVGVWVYVAVYMYVSVCMGVCMHVSA